MTKNGIAITVSLLLGIKLLHGQKQIFSAAPDFGIVGENEIVKANGQGGRLCSVVAHLFDCQGRGLPLVGLIVDPLIADKQLYDIIVGQLPVLAALTVQAVEPLLVFIGVRKKINKSLVIENRSRGVDTHPIGTIQQIVTVGVVKGDAEDATRILREQKNTVTFNGKGT